MIKIISNVSNKQDINRCYSEVYIDTSYGEYNGYVDSGR